MLVALLLPACAAPAIPPSRPTLESTALGFCRTVTAQMGMDATVDIPRIKFLRDQAAALLPAVRKGFPPGSPIPSLLEAAQGALEVLGGEELLGERRFGRAAKHLAFRWRERKKLLPKDSLLWVPEYEYLALLYELGGLRGNIWREEALRHRVRVAKGPDARLEKDLAAVVEDRYGPWLTVAELEPMLEFCGLLARAWLKEPDAAALTRRVGSQAFKDHADRVWRLAARKGADAFQADLGALLDRLDAGVLVKAHGDATLALAEALLGTPQETAARRLLMRMAVAAKSESCVFRGKIAHILGNWEAEGEFLALALGEEAPWESRIVQLRKAVDLLREHPHAKLLEEATRVLQAEALQGALKRGEGWGFPEAVVEIAALQRETGHGEEAEALIRLRLGMEDSDPGDRYRLLASLGRFAELEDCLGPPSAKEGPSVLGWRFRCALGQGREAAAREALLRWIDVALSLEPEASVPQLPGLALGRPMLRDAGDRLAALAVRFGPLAMPSQVAMLAREPAWILVAMDPEARDDPKDLEERLRWRLSRLTGGAGASAALEQLREEAEARLGRVHPLVIELLIKQVEIETDPDSRPLERVREFLKETGDPKGLQLSICQSLAALHSREGNLAGMEREGWRVLELLEEQEAPDPERVQGVALLLVLGLWRDQRLEELPELFIRLEHLGARLPQQPGKESFLEKFQEVQQVFLRTVRFKDLLRAARL